MNKFKVKVIRTDGEVIDTIVEGTDGPEFKGDNGMYKLLGCDMIEITGARYKDKDYDLYIDEEGRMKDSNTINPSATNLFCDWLDHEGRDTIIPNIVGDAALVDMEPIKELDTSEKEDKRTNFYEGGIEHSRYLENKYQ